MTQVYVILNPASGRGKSARFGQRITDALEAAGLAYELAETARAGHAVELAAAARRAGFEVVAAVGGDGTVSEVVNGLYQATPPGETVGALAVFPTGSANDLVDMLRGPKDPTVIAQRIAAGATRRIDLGHARYEADGATTKRVFDNNLGVGFEAQVTLESYKIRGLRGTPLYILAALRALRAYDSPRLTITWEDAAGHQQTRELAALLVSVGNSARTGGGFYLTPDAKLDDGLLDLGIAQMLPRWRILGLLPKALFGRHTTDPAVEMGVCRRLHITCHDPAPLHLDGEVVTQAAQSIEIHVEPGRLEIVV